MAETQVPDWAAEVPDWLRKMRPGDPVQITINGRLDDVCKGSLFRHGGLPDAHGLIMGISYGNGGQLNLLVDGEPGVTVTAYEPVQRSARLTRAMSPA